MIEQSTIGGGNTGIAQAAGGNRLMLLTGWLNAQ
jgi:hypothetical protein